MVIKTSKERDECTARKQCSPSASGPTVFQPPTLSLFLPPSSERPSSSTTLDRRKRSRFNNSLPPREESSDFVFFLLSSFLFFKFHFQRVYTTHFHFSNSSSATVHRINAEEKGAAAFGNRITRFLTTRIPSSAEGRDGGRTRKYDISRGSRKKKRESDLFQRHARVVVSTTGGGKTRAEFSIQLSRVTG